MDVGEKIRGYRALRDMTQRELAEKTGISEISIRKYESGERNPKPEQLRKIAEALYIGENTLIEIELNKIQLHTVGDLAAILFMLERNVGMELKLDTDEFGNEFSDDIIISFKNKKAQSLLKTIIVEPREEEFYRYKKNDLMLDTTSLSTPFFIEEDSECDK